MKVKINTEVIIEDVAEKLYEDFEDIEIAETKLSAFFGVIACCNTVKETQ